MATKISPEVTGTTGDVVVIVPEHLAAPVHDRLVKSVMPVDSTPLNPRLGWSGLSILRASTLPGVQAFIQKESDNKGGEKVITTFQGSNGEELLTIRTIKVDGVVMFNNVDLPEAR